MERGIFSKLFAKDELQEICSMANRRKWQTGLPVNIWVDEKKGYVAGRHAKRIKFQLTKANTWVEQGEASMTLDGEVVGNTFDKKKCEISAKDIAEVSNFVKNNSYALDRLADGRIFMDQFDEVMIKGGEPASEAEIGKLVEAVDNFEALNEKEE